MESKGKKYFLMGDQQYTLVEVDGPIKRNGKRCAVQFDHEAKVLRVSKQIPFQQRMLVVASAVSDACFRMWKPMPVIWPDWQRGERRASRSRRRDPGDGPPDR
jgi:hypothetical protein